MGLQIPRGLHSEASEENAICRATATPWGGVQKTGSAEGIADRGGASNAGSRAYDDLDPTEICGVSGGGVHQRKKCNPPGPDVRRAQAKLRRSKLLGQRLLRFDSRTGRAGDPRVHQKPGTGGYAPGAAQSVALSHL